MNHFILSDKLTDYRKIFFLCGPYCSGEKYSDRRTILFNCIRDLGNGDVLPLIIDKFLTKDNIADDTINIQIMEEICASIADYTYIFLDTLSTSAELGLFANTNCQHGIRVLIPKECDINKKELIGAFIKDAILSRYDTIKELNYCPQTKIVSNSSLELSEYYYFPNDIIPNCLRKSIENDIEDSYVRNMDIKYDNSDHIPNELHIINYIIDSNKIYIKIRGKLLFNIILKILYDYYDNDIKRNVRLSDRDIQMIIDTTKETLFNSASEYGKISRSVSKINTIDILTEVGISLEEFIRYSIVFLRVYTNYTPYGKEKKFRLYSERKPLVLLKDTKGSKIPACVFGLEEKDFVLCESITNNPKVYFDECEIVLNAKKRKLIKYKTNDKGEEARHLHSKIKNNLQLKFVSHKNSYAYFAGKSMKECVLRHINSVSFIKIDIKKFFNSISKEKLIRAIIDALEINHLFKNDVKVIVDSCYYGDQLPLGLVLSPFLSDVYLHSFDESMSEYAHTKSLKYTRYADDILLSSDMFLSDDIINSIIEFVSIKLKEKHLDINKDKMLVKKMNEEGDFIRYLGVSIIKKKEKNYISVGKRFIYEIARLYLYYLEIDDNDVEKDKEKFYLRLKIKGKIAFWEQIEGRIGLNRLDKRLKKYFPDGVNYRDI